MPSNQHTLSSCPPTTATEPPGDCEQMRTLVALAQDGDANAFGKLYDIYYDTVFRYVRYRVSTKALAEDLTSETFLRAWKRIDTFSWRGRDFAAWLTTIGKNLVADHYKSSRHRMEIHTAQMRDAARPWPFLADYLEPGPEELTVRAISEAELWGAVDRLTDAQRECVTLRILHDKSVRETAQAMGRNEGAIKTLLYRATRALHQQLTATAA